uniref:Putative secreted protein n=1 Tax=Anopheles darlingi TaxID=43151 RepID=A0A2M4D9F5_ANODA
MTVNHGAAAAAAATLLHYGCQGLHFNADLPHCFLFRNGFCDALTLRVCVCDTAYHTRPTPRSFLPPLIRDRARAKIAIRGTVDPSMV